MTKRNVYDHFLSVNTVIRAPNIRGSRMNQVRGIRSAGKFRYLKRNTGTRADRGTGRDGISEVRFCFQISWKSFICTSFWIRSYVWIIKTHPKRSSNLKKAMELYFTWIAKISKTVCLYLVVNISPHLRDQNVPSSLITSRKNWCVSWGQQRRSYSKVNVWRHQLYFHYSAEYQLVYRVPRWLPQ